jgi:hypothetical protein
LLTSEHLTYDIKEIAKKELEVERSNARLKEFPTVDGSSRFQVMVFKPDYSIRAASRLCICDLCKESYGSCALFEDFDLDVNYLKTTILRSDVSDQDHVISEELVIPESVCAVAASESSHESVWFLRIESEEEVVTEDLVDDYGHNITKGENISKEDI